MASHHGSIVLPQFNMRSARITYRALASKVARVQRLERGTHTTDLVLWHPRCRQDGTLLLHRGRHQTPVQSPSHWRDGLCLLLLLLREKPRRVRSLHAMDDKSTG